MAKFECEICHKCYSCLSYLKNHKNRHLIHERFKCSLCNKTFSAKGHLKAHILQHHKKEKKHICNICGSKFTRFSSLKTHLQLHISSVTYKCPFANCSKEYREKANLYIHTKKKHSTLTPLPSTNDSDDNEKETNKIEHNLDGLFNFYINEDENETLSDSDDHENVDEFLYKLIKNINLSSFDNVQKKTEDFIGLSTLS